MHKQLTKQQGFTLTELLVVIFGIGVIGLAIFAAYVLMHFIAKFW